jgi:hypothetical protein
VVADNDLSEYIDTLDKAKARLEKIECQLGERHNLSGNIREQLFALDKEGLLVEDELVADWHQAYAWYTQW